MSPKKKENWQTWWSIAGPSLPSSAVIIQDRILIEPITSEVFRDMKDYRAPVPSASVSSDNFVIHYPPRDEVQSRHKLQIDVTAQDADEAISLSKDIADRLLVSMTLVASGAHYHAELRKIRIANDKKFSSNFSEIIRVSPLEPPAKLDEFSISKMSNMFQLVEKDVVANNAYVHIISAWRLHSTPGSKPLERSILQHYVLCMEAVVNGVMEKIRSISYDRVRIEEREYARKFSEELPKRSDKPKAIREAAASLREISVSNVIPSIDKVAGVLGISDEISARAKELYRFRSRSISHPGQIKQSDLDLWLRSGSTVDDICLADRIARAFIEKYCESKI